CVPASATDPARVTVSLSRAVALQRQGVPGPSGSTHLLSARRSARRHRHAAAMAPWRVRRPFRGGATTRLRCPALSLAVRLLHGFTVAAVRHWYVHACCRALPNPISLVGT